MTVATVLPEGARSLEARAGLEETISDYLNRRGVQALVRVAEDETPYAGIRRLASTYGFGPLVPNTFLMGMSEKPAHRESFCENIAMLHRLRRNVILLRHDQRRGFGDRRRIDVWWGGLQKNGGLMMLLAYLLRTSMDWRQARVHVKLVVEDEPAAAAARENLVTMIEGLRIGAEAHILVADTEAFPTILQESSADADLVMLGLAAPTRVDDFPAYYLRLQEMTDDLPATAFVLASEDLDFGEVLL
jgi:hypothetical protein